MPAQNYYQQADEATKAAYDAIAQAITGFHSYCRYCADAGRQQMGLEDLRPAT